MTHFLASDENPDGFRLEDILATIRKDVLSHSLKIAEDDRTEALHVMGNNMKILNLLSDAITLAQDSTATLDKAFGKNTSDGGATPRIGVA